MPRLLAALVICVTILLPVQVNAVVAGDQNWLAMGGPEDGVFGGSVNVMLAVDNNIYMAGRIDSGGVIISSETTVDCGAVLKWDGVVWTCLDSGVNWYSVYALAADTNGNIYAAGMFNSANGVAVNNIAMWNGSTWQALGSGVNGWVTSLAVDKSNNDLYVSGAFTQAGGQSARYIARWNGVAWSAVDQNSVLTSPAYSMVFDAGGVLYMGSRVNDAGGAFVNGIASWDGNLLQAVGTGINGPVTSLGLTNNGQLVVGGTFNTGDGSVADSIAVWNGSVWAALGEGIDGIVYSIETDQQGRVIIAGEFAIGEGKYSSQIAEWNGISWSQIGAEFDYLVYDLMIMPNGKLYAAGDFYRSDDVQLNLVATWTDEKWRPLGSGVYSQVISFAEDGAGNVFTGVGNSGAHEAGGIRFNYVAKFGGSSWSAVGNPEVFPSNMVYDSETGNLFVGGLANSVGKVSRWDGVNWVVLGGDFNGEIYAVALDDMGNLYAGGSFTTVGGMPANHIAKWNGASWEALGSGTQYTVSAILHSGGVLYVSDQANVYHWNGSNMAAMGALASVVDLAADAAGKVVALSEFHGLNTWDGNAWIPLGIFDGWAGSMTIDSHGAMYVAGTFEHVNGIPAKKIARLDGVSWQALGSGIGGEWPMVTDLHVSEKGELYVGGLFRLAGGKPSNNIAVWLIDGDADGHPDRDDVFPFDPLDWLDTDSDGFGDNSDNCAVVYNTLQTDTDNDDIGDVCDTTPNGDTDNDGIDNLSDNCASVSNADQLDTDGDNEGNACDSDDDNDNVADVSDAFPLDATESVDTDSDGIGNNADSDDDSDAVVDIADNCPLVENVDQLDTDADGIGNVCEVSLPEDFIGAANSRTGASVAFAGDVNGDGYGDYIIGMPGYDIPASPPLKAIKNAGRAEVISGNDGAVLMSVIGTAANDAMGTAVAGNADINNDGLADVLVGAPLADSDAKDVGSVTVLFGPDGATSHTLYGEQAKAGFGTALALGDLDNDSYAEMIIGAPKTDDENRLADVGAVMVFDHNNTLIQTHTGIAAKDYFGSSVAVGDINHDGNADVIVGSPNADDGANGLVDAGNVTVLSSVTAEALFTAYGDRAKTLFGTSVAAGDVNHDGFDDVLVGSPGDVNGTLKNAGSIAVFSGSTGVRLTKQFGATASAYHGNSVAVGDVNGDGFADIIAGSWKDDTLHAPFISNAGSVFVRSGNGYRLLGMLYGNAANDYFGAAVSAGDINSDGKADVIIGVPGFTKGAGAVRVLSGDAL